MANTIFNQILTAVTSLPAGTSTGTLTSLVNSIANSGLVNQVKAELEQLSEVQSNPQATQAIVMQMITKSGFPASAVPLALSLTQPNMDPLRYSQIVTAIEAAVAAG